MKLLDDTDLSGTNVHVCQQPGVIVELKVPNSENGYRYTEDSHASCSGITFRSSSNGFPCDLIITNGLILKPFLHAHSNNNSELKKFVLNSPAVGHNVMYWRANELTDVTVYTTLTAKVSCKLAIPNTHLGKKSARILGVWRVPTLDQVLNSIFSSANGWSFALTQDASEQPNQNEARSMSSFSKNFEHENDEKLIRNLLPLFVLLETKEPIDISNVGVFSKAQLGQCMKCSTGDLTIFKERNSTAVTNVNKNTPRLTVHERSLHCKDIKQNLHMNPNRRSRAWSTSRFISIDDSHIMKLKRIYSALPIVPVQGTKVKVLSTPFGCLSPNVFINSLSEGIVSNVAGEGGVLIMTDARCVPGCEGGLLYEEDCKGSAPSLLGIVIAPFCWRRNEWVGLTFACFMRPLLSSLLKSITDCTAPKNSIAPNVQKDSCSSMFNNIALVKVGTCWGSAVIIQHDIDSSNSSEKRILLTCRHVVQKPSGSKVALHFQVGTCHEFSAEAVVLSSTSPGSVYDIAVLEVDNSNGHIPLGLHLSAKQINEGDPVLVIGHGLFDASFCITASVNSGIISKVLSRKGHNVLIQSTCAIHPGNSGGALIDAFSQTMLGIVVCNLRDDTTGACYPHINFSIPSTILLPVLKEYAKTGDILAFRRFQEDDPVVNSYWKLGHSQQDEPKHKL